MTLNIKTGDLETAFTDVCEELGCENDNEAALQAVDALKDRIRQLEEALRGITEHYVTLVNSGDAGNWNPETEPQVIAARRALGESK